MHQPLRNAAVTLQTQQGKVTADVFMNWFMKESSVTALCLLMLADGQRVCAFINDTRTAKSNDGAGAAASVANRSSPPLFRWPRWST